MKPAESPNPPVFASRNAAQPDFWNDRFAAEFTPWDRGGIPQDFAAFVQSQRPQRILIPGCGRANELSWLLAQGWAATAIDFSHEAVARAKAILPQEQHMHVWEADFFVDGELGSAATSWDTEPYDSVYECAFMCALPPVWRTPWAARVSSLLRPSGVLAGYFYLGATEKGPPFSIEESELHQLLSGGFQLIQQRSTNDSIAVFAGREQWMCWQKR
jgi:Thiopurine S-methyltransferase (TPMT)